MEVPRRPSDPLEGMRVVYHRKIPHSPYQNQAPALSVYKKRYTIAEPRPGQKPDDFRGLETLKAMKERSSSIRLPLLGETIGISRGGRFVLKIPQRNVRIPLENGVLSRRDCTFPGCEFKGTTLQIEQHLLTHFASQERQRLKGVSCSECLSYFYSRVHLLKHVSEEHGISGPIIKKQFDNQNEFNKWVNSLRNTYCVDFVSAAGAREWNGGNRISYLVCSRSGERKEKTQLSRRSKPTIKSGKTCIAFIKIRQSIIRGKEVGPLFVEACLQHSGHSIHPSRILLSADELNAVAQLARGVPKDLPLDVQTARTFLNGCPRLRLVSDDALMEKLSEWIRQVRFRKWKHRSGGGVVESENIIDHSCQPLPSSAPSTSHAHASEVFPLLDQEILQFESDEDGDVYVV